jgi:hypothetical protein
MTRLGRRARSLALLMSERSLRVAVDDDSKLW